MVVTSWRSPDLRTLVKRCLAGDQGSMLALVERFQGQVFGLCYRMLGQRQDAEDAAQETFVRVLKNLHRWDQGRDFSRGCSPLPAIAAEPPWRPVAGGLRQSQRSS